MPPRRLMVRVAGTADPDWFLRSGRAGYDAIAAHVPLHEVDSVLDFGCGCGRVTRYWHAHTGSVTGTDLSADEVDWCRVNLPFARFERNLLAPPLIGTLVLLGAGLVPATDSPSWVPSSSSSESKAPANIFFLSSSLSMFAGDMARWLRLSLMMLLVLVILLWLRSMSRISNSILYHVLDLLRVVFACL